MEEWKDIPGYEGYYQVSDIGRVRSVDRKVKHSRGGYCLLKGKIRKTPLMKSGYPSICLLKNGVQKMFYVHQLVAMAFLGHKPNGFNLLIDHKDNNKENNLLSNLQITTIRINNTKDIDVSKNTSKYTGVFWNSFYKKWTSRIGIKYQVIHLINSDSEIECKEYYDLALRNSHLFNGDKPKFKKLLENEKNRLE